MPEKKGSVIARKKFPPPATENKIDIDGGYRCVMKKMTEGKYKGHSLLWDNKNNILLLELLDILLQKQNKKLFNVEHHNSLYKKRKYFPSHMCISEILPIWIFTQMTTAHASYQDQLKYIFWVIMWIAM